VQCGRRNICIGQHSVDPVPSDCEFAIPHPEGRKRDRKPETGGPVAARASPLQRLEQILLFLFQFRPHRRLVGLRIRNSPQLRQRKVIRRMAIARIVVTTVPDQLFKPILADRLQAAIAHVTGTIGLRQHERLVDNSIRTWRDAFADGLDPYASARRAA